MVAAAAVATATLLIAVSLVDLQARSMHVVLEQKRSEAESLAASMRDDMRRAMLKLSFNVLILPAGTELKAWYADRAEGYMPEAYVERLASSGIVTVRHLLPALQKKTVWPETGRTILLVGTRGEVANVFKSPKKPLVQPVPDGSLVLGYELHRSLNLHTNDTATLLGRAFRVHACHERRGTKDDITAWIPLKAAQDLLGAPGQINSILALECLCAGSDALERIRADIRAVLPDTQVVEMGTRVLARAEARMRVAEDTAQMVEEERIRQNQLLRRRTVLAAALTPPIMLLSGLCIGALAFANGRSRRYEMALLRSLGLSAAAVLILVAGKLAVLGLAGGALGCAAGLVAVGLGATGLPGLAAGDVAAAFSPVRLLGVCLAAPLLALVAGWLPTVLTARADPATVLHEAEDR
jgi:hypothetical protein